MTTPQPSRRRRRGGFGTVERLPSGRFRARWRDPSGRRSTAEQTFPTTADARAFLATVEADLLRRTYRAPRRVSETLSTYGARWVEMRPGLKDSTRHQYAIDFRRHVEPYLGPMLLDQIEPDRVRAWHAALSADLRAKLGGPPEDGRSRAGSRNGSATVARSYRLLRAILQTAVDDELLLRNPCRIAGASEPRSAERPTLSVAELAALAAVVPSRYRALVLMAGFSGLRAGELAALRVRDLQLVDGASAVKVTRRLYRVGGRITVDDPKSEAGGRTVALPAFVGADLRRHLTEHRSGAGPDDLLFLTAGGREILDTYSQILRRGLDKIGRGDCRGHDLRHSAMTAAAEHGATLATLMQMAGHSTPAAAQRYQHATAEHARRVAVAMDATAAGVLAAENVEPLSLGRSSR